MKYANIPGELPAWVNDRLDNDVGSGVDVAPLVGRRGKG
jgi:hypothetical protein